MAREKYRLECVFRAGRVWTGGIYADLGLCVDALGAQRHPDWHFFARAHGLDQWLSRRGFVRQPVGCAALGMAVLFGGDDRHA